MPFQIRYGQVLLIFAPLINIDPIEATLQFVVTLVVFIFPFSQAKVIFLEVCLALSTDTGVVTILN